MTRTSNGNINSIMLYHWAIKATKKQDLVLFLCLLIVKADKGFEPPLTDHESVMLPLHQSA